MIGKAYRAELITPSDRIIVAYDEMDWIEINETAREVGPYTGLGKTTSAHVRPGADYAVNQLAICGQMTMLDFKFHDIPNTVKLSVREAAAAGGAFITVHASGNEAMLQAAVQGAELGRSNIADVCKKRSLSKLGIVLGITVLTSMDALECESIYGIPADDLEGIQKKVISFAQIALYAGLGGVVCSPLEARAIRADSRFDDLLIIAPGITPLYAVQAGDQKRTASAKDAMNDGVDLIIIGRALNKAKDYGLTKVEAAIAVGEEIKTGLAA